MAIIPKMALYTFISEVFLKQHPPGLTYTFINRFNLKMKVLILRLGLSTMQTQQKHRFCTCRRSKKEFFKTNIVVYVSAAKMDTDENLVIKLVPFLHS